MEQELPLKQMAQNPLQRLLTTHGVMLHRLPPKQPAVGTLHPPMETRHLQVLETAPMNLVKTHWHRCKPKKPNLLPQLRLHRPRSPVDGPVYLPNLLLLPRVHLLLSLSRNPNNLLTLQLLQAHPKSFQQVGHCHLHPSSLKWLKTVLPNSPPLPIPKPQLICLPVKMNSLRQT